MRTLLTLSAGLLLAVPAAATGGPELTFQAGLRYGQASFPVESKTALIVCVTTPCGLAEATTEEGDVLPSLILDVPITARWMIEGLLTRESGDLAFASPLSLSDRETYKMRTAQVGLLRHWGEGRYRPFVTGAVGVTQFETNAMAYERPLFPGIVAAPIDDSVFSSSVAAGVKAEMSERWALRVEGRSWWHDLSNRAGGSLQQSELGVGLTYRW